MYTDHFDGKSIARRSLEWLHAAAQDAYTKRDGCKGNSPAHEAMWAAKAEKYSAEITRREKRKAA
jgi:hypothetical protein